MTYVLRGGISKEVQLYYSGFTYGTAKHIYKSIPQTKLRENGAHTALHTSAQVGALPVDSVQNDTSDDYYYITMIPRRPRAPPPRAAACRQISSKAGFVNRISTPEYPNRA
jgi:hypothetical protein